MSASELIRSPVFQPIRNKNLEKPAESKVDIPIDNDGSYDYENF